MAVRGPLISMSTTHGQPGLSSEQRSTIRSTILNARQILEDEFRRQLEKYGIHENKRLRLDDLSHLSAEERHTRHILDAAIERELESTEGDLERSITNYVREATKTYLNRFVALKTIEVRGLVEETITERPEYGNRSYMHHTVAEIAGELTNAPDDGFGAALDLAYQEIGAEIQMIFEESEHTTIDLDPQVRNKVLDELATIEDDAWENDETLGWVYQYFGEDERGEIDDRIDKENYKVQGTDIATKTQLFTPSYIVQWLVDNSLGRLWLEMQGDRTSIADEDNCFYLAPREDSLIDRESKDVRDIKVLDPACGSGHMLFYAFDVLYEMYLEEAQVPEAHIPNKILKNNLYGIDIDPGVAQLAALSLYVKAKTKEPDVEIEQINIVSADAILVNGDKKKSILEGLGEPDRSILEKVWESFENIREYGSLVRIEEKVDEILEEYEEETGHEFASGQTRLSEGGMAGQGSLDTTNQGEEWPSVREEIKKRISNLANRALEQNNPVEEMFADEVEKSIRLLDLLLYDYDVVVSNPPYLGSRKMGGELKNFVKENYTGYRDLYASFIERCGEFAGEDKYVSMITMETFMYLYSFRKVRPQLLDEMNIIDVAHLENRDKGYMNVAFLLRKSNSYEDSPSRFNRLVNIENKINGLGEITKANRRKEQHKNVYVVDQDSFKNIGRTPFIYWLGQEVLELFPENPTIEDIGVVRAGLETGNDEQFVRKWWEISDESRQSEYVIYQKSGTNNLYYDFPDDFLNWGDDGQKLRNFDEGNGTPNEQHYFTEAITVRGFGNKLVARRFTEKMVFSHISPYIYSDEVSRDLLLGLLSSSVYRFIANGLNPGLHFEAGDIKQLPIKTQYSNGDKIQELVGTAVMRQKHLSCLVEYSADFDPELLEETVQESIMNLARTENMAKADVRSIHGLVDNLIFEEHNISDITQSRIYENLPQNLADFPHITNVDDLDTSELTFREKVQTKTLPGDEYNQLVDAIDERKDNDIYEISEDLEISPYTVAMVCHKQNLYTRDEKRKTAGRLLSYYLGCAIGRWELDGLVPDEDGIITFDERDGNSVVDYIYDCIELTFGSDELDRMIQDIESLLGRDIEGWLRDRFFRYHHVDEYKRRGQRIPIYWQLESPDGAFSCFIYYHNIDGNTLPKLRGQYLDPRIDRLDNELETLNAQTNGDNPDKELLNRKEETRNDLEDIKEFRDIIDEMIDDGVSVDPDKGIWENIKQWDRYEILETGLPKLKSSYSR